MRLGVNVLVDFRVKDDLGNPPAVAQVDEYDAAVITAAEDPAHKDGFLPQVIKAKSVTVVCAPERSH